MGFDDTWADADVDGNNDTAPPDGTYDVALVDARAFTSKSENDMVVLEWQTVDKSHQWSSLHGFGSQQQAGFTKGTCMKVGVNVEDVASLEELDARLKECVARFYEVEVKRNGEYVNTHILDGQGPPMEPDVPADTRGLEPAAAKFGDDAPWGGEEPKF